MSDKLRPFHETVLKEIRLLMPALDHHRDGHVAALLIASHFSVLAKSDIPTVVAHQIAEEFGTESHFWPALQRANRDARRFSHLFRGTKPPVDVVREAIRQLAGRSKPSVINCVGLYFGLVGSIFFGRKRGGVCE